MKKLLLVACLFLHLYAKAQNPTVYYAKPDSTNAKIGLNEYIITLKDHTTIRGTIISQNTREATIQTANMGIVTVPTNQIMSINLLVRTNRPSRGSMISNVYYENRFVNRLYFTPSGFASEKGSFEYHNHAFYISEFTYAPAKNISLGTAFFTFAPSLLYNFKLKASLYQSERINFSATGTFWNSENNTGVFAIIPSLSIGKKEAFFNISPIILTENSGGGYGLSLGYMKKVSPLMSVFTENFFAISNGTEISDTFMLSGGCRFDRANHAFDVSITIPAINGGFTPRIFLIPSASYHLKINNL